jgi:hypothetical protein
MKLKVKKKFDWAHGGHTVKSYEQGAVVDPAEVCLSEDDEAAFIKVSAEEGWTAREAPAKTEPTK